MEQLIFTLVMIFVLCLSYSSGQQIDRLPEFHKAHEIIYGNNEFALKLLQTFTKPKTNERPGNLFCSPASISMALGMLFLGSRGQTAAQIAKVFDWNVQDFEEVHTAFQNLHEALQSADFEHGELRLANRLWGHSGFELLEEFSKGTQQFYHSEMTQADFANRFEDTRTEINSWVHQQTQGNIKDFIPHGVINSVTKLVLVNAIYFKGVWEKEFSEGKTFHAPFFVPEPHELKLEVKMMSLTMQQNYYHDVKEKCKILELPYSGRELAMVIILPDEHDGITQLEKGLDAEKLDNWLILMQNTTVEVSIPKFTLSQQFDLSTTLQELGITDVFDAAAADLSGITATGGLFVSNVIHRAHIDVNERGTEAAAATGVTMMKRSIEMNEVFYTDHPYLFFIYHVHSRAILFLGKVLQPNQVGEATDLHKHKPLSDEL